MNKRRPGAGGRAKSGTHGGHSPSAARRPARPPRPSPATQASVPIVERRFARNDPNRPFRILIAVHRPRFRGRAERAAALGDWEVVSLLNKQDPVGQVAKPPSPPDLLLLSGDFGRQRDYAIFRAVQAWRSKGMRLIGLVDDCETPPEKFPDSAPERLCDICLPPPYKTADLRALLIRLYEEMRGKSAPPPRHAAPLDESEEEES